MVEKSIEHHSIINLYYILCNEFGIKYSMIFPSLSSSVFLSLFPYFANVYLFHNVQGLFMNNNKKQQQNCLQENIVYFPCNMLFFLLHFLFFWWWSKRQKIDKTVEHWKEFPYHLQCVCFWIF